MFKNPRQSGYKKGESLVEVIMAIFVVAMGSAVATSLIISALQSNQFSRDNLIALNLAVEGLEAMRAIRDANWLRFSYDKENCWNMRPEADCSGLAVAIAEGKYTVDLDPAANNFSWGLPTSGIGTALDLDNTSIDNTPYQIAYFDISPGDSDHDGTVGNDHDILATATVTGLTQTGLSRFYRMVTITYNNPSPTCTQATGVGCDEMDVESNVQWQSQGITHKVVLTTKLTDYQKVKVK